MRLRLCCILLTLLPAFAAAELSFEEVLQQLAAPPVLRGSFSQERQIALLENPLRSSGYFMLSELGLYWHQDQPLQAVMIADGERLLQGVDGGELQSIDVTKNPIVLTFSTSFLSIFTGSETELRSNFDIEFSSQEDIWMINLTPTQYPLNELIDSIGLQGQEYIEILEVTSRSSDKTTIRFSDLQTQPAQLTDHEIERYAR